MSDGGTVTLSKFDVSHECGILLNLIADPDVLGEGAILILVMFGTRCSVEFRYSTMMRMRERETYF